jgi:hypothetical protein
MPNHFRIPANSSPAPPQARYPACTAAQWTMATRAASPPGARTRQQRGPAWRRGPSGCRRARARPLCEPAAPAQRARRIPAWPCLASALDGRHCGVPPPLPASRPESALTTRLPASPFPGSAGTLRLTSRLAAYSRTLSACPRPLAAASCLATGSGSSTAGSRWTSTSRCASPNT